MSKYDKETKFYWLQLKEDFFEDDAINWLEEQKPNGRDYAYFYLKLCLKSLKSNGILIRKVGNILIPYDNKKLAELTKMDFDTVCVAMELLKKIGLVQVLDNGQIYLTQLESLIGSKSLGALKKQQQIALRNAKKDNLIEIKEKSQKLLSNVEYDENGLPILKKCVRLTKEQIQLPTGKIVFVDEKRYGGNGGLAYERAKGLCEDCGSSEELRIHHENGYSNELEDLIILCNTCHGIHHSKEYKEKMTGGQEAEKFPPKIEIKDKVKDIIKDKNKEIDVSCNNYNNIIKYIEKNFGRCLSPIEYEEIEKWLLLPFEENDKEKIVSYAVRIAVMNNVRTFKYVNGILNNWRGKGLTTFLEVVKDNVSRETTEEDEDRQYYKSLDQEELFDYDWLNDNENT